MRCTHNENRVARSIREAWMCHGRVSIQAGRCAHGALVEELNANISVKRRMIISCSAAEPTFFAVHGPSGAEAVEM